MLFKVLTGAALAVLASTTAAAQCASGSNSVTPEGIIESLEGCAVADELANPSGGLSNVLQVQQLGQGAIAVLEQRGQGNFIDLTQRDNSDAEIRQFGNDNAAIVNQPSDAILYLRQNGDGNYFEVDQDVEGFEDIEIRQDNGAAIIIRNGG